MQNLWITGLILASIVGSGAVMGYGMMDQDANMHHWMHGEHEEECEYHEECEFEHEECEEDHDDECYEEHEEYGDCEHHHEDQESEYDGRHGHMRGGGC